MILASLLAAAASGCGHDRGDSSAANGAVTGDVVGVATQLSATLPENTTPVDVEAVPVPTPEDTQPLDVS
jgi:hypothetical protein